MSTTSKTTRLFALLLCIVTALQITSCSIEEKTNETSAPTVAEVTSAPSGQDSEHTGKRVYFAGPLFNQGEKEFNLKLTNLLEAHGYTVFLPQRDGIEAALLEGKSEQEMSEMIFALDEGEVLKADILFMNLDGRAPDEGACVELGIAYANGLRCYGVKTDTRSVEKSLDINPMITGCMTELFTYYDGDELIAALEQYLSENEL
ncbi:Nucleoside 2-deoxyribosyltransferase [Ruminococcaceae bacterium YRB3002]|nr:Nucleoside 2-deoxyribosyltransferase [Ruminococcaceae bacterium YRB3002]